MSYDRTPPQPEPGIAPAPRVALHLGGLAAGTPILAASGLVPVDRLLAGDRIVTRTRGMQRLAFVTQRLVLRGTVIRIRPEGFGGLPTDPALLVAPSQRLVLRDWRAKALFGHDRARVAASKLVDGEWVARQAAEDLRLYSLHFDAELSLYAGGIEISSAAPVTAFLNS